MHNVLVVFTVYVPTNSGLAYAREKGLERIQKQFQECELDVQDQIGDNIPRLVDALRPDEELVIGITGRDILENYNLTKLPPDFRGRPRGTLVRNHLLLASLGLSGTGPYEQSVFGLPTLCILGTGGISLRKFREAYPYEWRLETRRSQPEFRGRKVVVPERYRTLVRSLVDLSGAEVTYLDGKVDITAARGDADYAIDIVLSGKTCMEEGLGFFPPILYKSDGILISNNTLKAAGVARSKTPHVSDFDLWLNTGRVRRSPIGNPDEQKRH